MGRYLFENDKVQFWNSQGQGIMSCEDFRVSEMALDRQAHILLATEEGAGAFVRIREVKDIFRRGKIRTFVPYADALRMFLLERKLMESNQICMVLDDVGDHFLLTVISTAQVLVTRVIAGADLDKVMEEMRRTRKNIVDRKEKITWRVLSNHQGLVKALEDAQAVFFETFLPAMQVLGRVKFPHMLMTPEEMAISKRRQRLIVLLGAAATGILVAMAGLGYYGQMCLRSRQMEAALKTLNLRQMQVQGRLKQLVMAGYQARLKGFPSAELAINTDDLFNSFLPGMQLESVTFERAQERYWQSTAMILLVDGQFVPWAGQGVWAKAQVSPFWGQGHPGMRVSAADRQND